MCRPRRLKKLPPKLNDMTIRQAISKAVCAMEAAGVPDSRIDAELLLSHVTGLDRLRMLLAGANELTPEQEQRFSSLLLSRAGRKPLQYLLGTQIFYGLTFQVDSRVLIPRQETEELCELGIAHLKKLGSAPRALDLCTGSGAIAVALSHECPFVEVCASDLSTDALSLAKENAASNGVAVQFYQGDLFAPLEGQRFDLILSNPPYIPTQECDTLQAEVMQEPRMALDGGTDGFDFYRRIAREAAEHLTPRGMIAVEAGDGEADGIAALFRESGLHSVSVHMDLYGMPRMVSAYAKEQA